MRSMGALYIVSTPIGNLDDISIRAKKTLSAVSLILCEDTRRTANLITHVKLMRFDEHTEEKMLPEVLEMLTHKDVALVSDAGTPLISDPGYRLVSACIKRGIKVISIPGPSAVLAALTSSGLPANKFMFLGYPPEKQSHRLKLFQSLPKDITIIFYCAPHKLKQTLLDLKESYGDIHIVIARELTKIHEDIWRGTLSKALTEFQLTKGEFVLLLTL